MPKYVDLDAVVPMLQQIQKDTPDVSKAAMIDAFLVFLKHIPADHRERVVKCCECWWYDGKRCIHQQGLPGKLGPASFCSFGAVSDDGTNVEMPTLDIDEFFKDVNIE